MGGFRADDLVAGRYRLSRKLGTGGMATVWLAADERLGRPVALKLISEALADDDSFRRRFEREAETAARLQHPNLVTVFDAGNADGRPFLVMELIEGRTLAAAVRSHKLGPLEGMQLAEELLGALGTVHAAGVIHRDVKPSNVLLDQNGSARLTDFGISRSEAATRLTQTGQAIGTLAYMAPEVMAGDPGDERSDLYALGVLLDRSIRREGRGDLEPLIGRLTEPDPSRRPRDSEQALSGLSEDITPVAPVPFDPGSPHTDTAITERAGTPPAASRIARKETPARSRWRSVRALAIGVLAMALGAGLAFAIAGGDLSPEPETTTEVKAVTETETVVETETVESTVTETSAPIDCQDLADRIINGDFSGLDPDTLDQALQDCGLDGLGLGQ